MMMRSHRSWLVMQRALTHSHRGVRYCWCPQIGSCTDFSIHLVLRCQMNNWSCRHPFVRISLNYIEFLLVHDSGWIEYLAFPRAGFLSHLSWSPRPMIDIFIRPRARPLGIFSGIKNLDPDYPYSSSAWYKRQPQCPRCGIFNSCWLAPLYFRGTAVAKSFLLWFLQDDLFHVNVNIIWYVRVGLRSPCHRMGDRCINKLTDSLLIVG